MRSRLSSLRHHLGMAVPALLAAYWPAAAGAVEGAQPTPPTINDFGSAGLIQMPSGRIHDDGTLYVGASSVPPYRRFTLMLQGLPRVEGIFRYTEVTNRLYGPREFSGDQTLKDRGFDLKFLLLREGRNNPAVALGLRDMLGTAAFSGEYLVASRRYYDWDFTLGMAWGNMGTRGQIANPFGILGEGMKVRPGGRGAGQFANNLFRGERAGIFGGIEYQTPIEKLRVKLEYDANNYQSEPRGNRFTVRSPINAALVYHPLPMVELSTGFERGTTAMFRVSVFTNLQRDLGLTKQDRPPQKLKPRAEVMASLPPPPGPPTQPAGPPPPPLASEPPAPAGSTPVRGASRDDPVMLLFDGFERLGFEVEEVSLFGTVATLSVTGASFGHAELARGARVVASTLPATLTEVNLLSLRSGDEWRSTRFDVQEIMRAQTPDEMRQATIVSPGPAGTPQGRTVLSAITPPAPSTQQTISRRIFERIKNDGMKGEAFDLSERQATLYFTNTKYTNLATALGRAGRVVHNNVPDYVEEFTLVLYEGGLELRRVTVLRRDLETAAQRGGNAEEVWAKTTFGGRGWGIPAAAIQNPDRYPDFGFRMLPRLRQHVGGPDNFYFWQLWLALTGGAELARGLTVGGTVGLDIVNNFAGLTLASDSTLPHVRSDIKDYLKEGQNNLVRLETDYVFSPAKDWYGRVSAGIFEEMYAGVSGEVLYRPADSRLAVGLDINRVRKRDFDQRFSFLDYQVTTGHLSLYYQVPFYDLLASVRMGRYLARDRGATFDVSRTFENGMRFGAFATFTNVSSEDFGEGAFDKGFYMAVPLQLFTTTPTRATAALLFRPLTRDGGQVVNKGRRLYGLTAQGNTEELAHGWGGFLD